MHITTGEKLFPLPRPNDGAQEFFSLSIYRDTRIRRIERRALETAPFGSFVVEADPFPPTAPPTIDDFDSVALKWAFRCASFVTLWAGGIPPDTDELTKRFTAHARSGSRVLIALVRTEKYAPWCEYAFRWMKPGTETLLVAPQEALQ